MLPRKQLSITYPAKYPSSFIFFGGLLLTLLGKLLTFDKGCFLRASVESNIGLLVICFVGILYIVLANEHPVTRYITLYQPHLLSIPEFLGCGEF